MKIVYLLFFALASVSVSAQELTKAEKKKIKKMSVEDISAIIKNLDSKSNDLKKCSSEKEEMQYVLTNMSNEFNALKSENDSLKKTTVSLKEEMTKEATSMANNNPVKPKKGMYFKVQLGAYNQYRAKGLTKSEIETEIVENQIKYVLGYFTSVSKAEEFRNELKKMGLADAWIVCYKDGQRISQEEAEAAGVKFSK